MNNNKLRNKNFIWNVIGTSLNAFNSLFFLIIVTRWIGTDDAGIFSVCFSLACLFCIIGTYYGRVFHVTDISDKINNREYIVHRIITCCIMMIVSFIFGLINGYNTYKMIILLLLCLYKCNEAFSEIFYGILQKNNLLYVVGRSLSIKSVLSVITFFVVSYFYHDMIMASVIINIIWLAITLIYDIPKYNKVKSQEENVHFHNIICLFKLGFYTFVFSFLGVYLANMPKYLLDNNVSNELQAIFGIIIMPSSIISLCAQYFISPYTLELADSYKKGDKTNFNKRVRFLVMMVVLIGILAIIGMRFLGINLLELIYGLALKPYTKEIIIILIGAMFYSISTVLSSALITVRYTFIQLINYVICTEIGTVVTLVLISKISLLGASLGYCFTMCVQMIIYIVSYITIIKKCFLEGGKKMLAKKKKNKYIKIYVATHKEYDFPEDDLYVPIHVGSEGKKDLGYLKDNTGDNISLKNKNYCELTALYWIWKNDTTSKYVGLAHYRRYFVKKTKRVSKDNKFSNLLTRSDVEELMDKYDVVVSNPFRLYVKNVKTKYVQQHYLEDLENCERVLKKLKPEYSEAFDKTMKDKQLCICNMFIMSKKLLDEYCEWLFDILFELEKITDLTGYSPLQQRLYGFLSERLFNVWLNYHKELKIGKLPIQSLEHDSLKIIVQKSYKRIMGIKS